MQVRRGSILAETVIVMPILLMLIFGVIQFALVWTAKQMTAYAAFCATRAVMVVPNSEKKSAAQNAAEVALSWMCAADDGKAPVSIPGWGEVKGSGTSGERVKTTVISGYNGESGPVAAVKVEFRYPLLVPGMAVNRIIANAKDAPELEGDANFYGDISKLAGNPKQIGGWPFVVLTETCVLPMPYSTSKFPKGGFSGTNIHGGGS